MRARVVMLSLVVPLALVAACGGDDFEDAKSSGAGGGGGGGEGGGAAGTCADICAKRAELNCAGETLAKCEADCTYTTALFSWCDELVGDAIDCVAAEPPESFSCEDTGNVLDIKESVCTAEVAVATDCFYEGPPEGLPDLSGDCVAICSATSHLLCHKADCERTCLQALETSEKCNGAAAGYVQCAAAEPSESWQCDLAVPSKPELKNLICGEYALVFAACLAG